MLQLLHVNLYIWHDRKGSAKTSSKLKSLLRRLVDLKITRNLEKGRRFCNVLDNPVLITPEKLPIKGKTIKSCFLRTVKVTGFGSKNLFKNLKAHASIIFLGQPFLRNISFNLATSK